MEKYHTTPTNLKKTLNKYGVAIIPKVLNKKEVLAMKKGMWDTLEHLTKNVDKPIKRKDKDTYKSIRELYPLHSMLIQHWSIGHAKFIWDIRQNKKVANIFAKLWKVKPIELLTSFDGASFHMPPEITKIGWYRKNDWLHTDQSYTRNDLECIQSWVTAFDVNEGDATLTCLEGSHKYHKDFAKEFKITDKSDWFKLQNDEQAKFYKDKGCKRINITCPAGSMVFWDSRTIHCGQEALKERAKPNFRCVVYICMTPRKLATIAVLKKKQKAVEEMRTTSHWPHKPKLFGKYPRTYGNPLPDVPELPKIKDKLTPLGLKLAGY